MFLEILQGLKSVVDMLNIFDKKIQLTSNYKRRLLGKQLRELYTTVQRLEKNCIEIENHLERIIKSENNYSITEINIYIELVLFKLVDLLTEQKIELINLREILRANYEDSPISLIVDIYGEENGEELYKLAEDKYSLISGVTHYILKRSTSDRIRLPKSFRLANIAIFTEAYNNNFPFHYLDYYLNNDPNIENKITTEIKLQLSNNPNFIKIIKEECLPLFNEALEFQSSQKLLEIRKNLRNMIKSNFKIEEIF